MRCLILDGRHGFVVGDSVSQACLSAYFSDFDGPDGDGGPLLLPPQASPLGRRCALLEEEAEDPAAVAGAADARGRCIRRGSGERAESRASTAPTAANASSSVDTSTLSSAASDVRSFAPKPPAPSAATAASMLDVRAVTAASGEETPTA